MVEALGYLRARVLGVVATSRGNVAAFGRAPALTSTAADALSLTGGPADDDLPPVLRWLAIRSRTLFARLRRTIRFDHP
jgi:hypothetical protein